MDKKVLKYNSKLLSYLLRHHPEDRGIVLDEYGWADVNSLCKKLFLSTSDLELIVDSNDKKRFRFNEDYSKIKASQGHSIKIKSDLEEVMIKDAVVLYHGTKMDFVDSIKKSGLMKMDRNHVHLSATFSDAKKVAGRRKGDSVILLIDSFALIECGHKLYKSENGVYLIDHVPPGFISSYVEEPR